MFAATNEITKFDAQLKEAIDDLGVSVGRAGRGADFSRAILQWAENASRLHHGG